ncbi:MAG: hypothetical protein K2O41_04860 [Clostridia bacterium]|nr:hypothetical protein [Clostridia bacterium]
MKKKRVAVAALASCIALSATFAGCSLVSTNNRRDMEQVIATVNISQSDKLPKELAEYKSAITTTSILKRELVSYFLNVGYSYVSNNGMTYEQTFNMLVDALVDNAVLTQYCTLELLAADETKTLSEFSACKNDVEKYVYLLGGEDSDDVRLAKYSLLSSLNSAIDNNEKTLIDEDDGYEGTDTRTTPTNLNTEQDDYYPGKEEGKLDYNVYTGYKNYLLSDSGSYKDDAIEGTTRTTRIKAYNTFISNLSNNYLIDEDEDLTDIWSLKYIQTEYLNQLKSRVINKYYDVYEEQQEEALKDGETAYAYVQSEYENILKAQTDSYNASSSAFESAMGSMSSNSFILYSPSTADSELFDDTHHGSFGFVYNILLPFNAKQSAQLSELNSILSANDDKDAYYIARNEILKGIETTDQRSAWFNGATKYAFKAADSTYTEDYYGKSYGREYLFFEDNLTKSGENGRYKKLQAYDGRYAYNGKAYENKDGSYTLVPEKLNIDGMLEEFSAYINFVLGPDSVICDTVSDYYDHKKFSKDDNEDEIDYSRFVYASGKVKLGDFVSGDLMNPDTTQYKAMSAVNELQFAYTTDTGVLSNYIGYTVSAYDTSYIKEFEYAAKAAVNEGAGAFTVCAGDYGWHLIYVTYAFDLNGGKVNGETIDWSRIKIEGTFENLFFEWIKSNDLSNVTSTRRSKIISDFNKDSTVVKYQDRYQDLLDLDK